MYARYNGVARKTILDNAVWAKSKMASISARLSYRVTSFSTEWTQKHNFGVYHRVFKYIVWLESSLDIALWVKSKMAAIYDNQKLL